MIHVLEKKKKKEAYIMKLNYNRVKKKAGQSNVSVLWNLRMVMTILHCVSSRVYMYLYPLTERMGSFTFLFSPTSLGQLRRAYYFFRRMLGPCLSKDQTLMLGCLDISNRIMLRAPSSSLILDLKLFGNWLVRVELVKHIWVSFAGLVNNWNSGKFSTTSFGIQNW